MKQKYYLISVAGIHSFKTLEEVCSASAGFNVSGMEYAIVHGDLLINNHSMLEGDEDILSKIGEDL